MNENYMKFLTIAVVFVLGMVSAAAVVLSTQEGENTNNNGGNPPPVTPVNQPPIASMYASDTTVYLGEGVRFDASASADPDGNITAYYFDFGDGTTAGWQSEPTAEHTYSALGDYTASLKVKDDNGTESTNEMKILISVHEPPASEEIKPSSRSMDNFTEVQETVDSSPLAVPPQEDVPEVKGEGPEMDVPDLPYENATGEPEFPDIEEPEKPEVKMDTGEKKDPEDMNAGYQAYMNWENASNGFEGKLNEQVDEGSANTTELETDHVGEFEKEFATFNRSRDSPDTAKHFNYRAISAVNISAHDNDGDGNPERVHIQAVAYEALGRQENPRYESYYASEVRMFDNNSDGNAEYLRINEFGFESVDKDGDGNPEYVMMHIRVVVRYDNNSDGNPEFVHYSNATFVKVDKNDDGHAEFQAAHFTEVKAHDENSDGNFRWVVSTEWGARTIDRNNNSNYEYAAVFGKKLVLYDNSSNGSPNFVHYTTFGYTSVDRNDDGKKEFSEIAYHNIVGRDNNSDGNPEFVLIEKAYARHNSVKNLSLASYTRVVMFDNSSDGRQNYIHHQKVAWVVLDTNRDGNPGFQAVHYEDFVLYRNNTASENASYIRAWTFTGAMWDNNSDGNPDRKYYSAEGFVMVDEDQDGTPETVWHVKYEGNGS